MAKRVAKKVTKKEQRRHQKASKHDARCLLAF